MTSQIKILGHLRADKGVTARDLARLLGKRKSEVNPYLYKLQMEKKARVDSNLRWFLGPPNSHDTSRVTAAPAAEVAINFEAIATSITTKASAQPVYVPTDEQTSVIQAPVGGRLYVEAGPGTGKSETLVARLKHLLGNGGLNPAQVLILSFSVAAVKELKARIEKQAAGNSTLAFIDIRTFDSYASRFLRQLIPSPELQSLNYDQRILRATEEIKSNPSAARLLSGLKHVFLDEMQDLVGVRADFALALLLAVKPSFTLFGDSAQGIYDFTIEHGPSTTTSGDLLESIRSHFRDLDERHRFTKNHRVAGNPRLETIAQTGRHLLLESAEKARVFLEHEFGSLGGHGTTQNPTIHSSLLNGSTCVVCRTNGQVFRLAGQLIEKGIPFQLARDKNEFLPPAWLGRVFLGWQDDPVRESTFLDRTQTILGVDESTAQFLWSGLLAACAGPRAVSFSLADLRAAISDGLPLPEQPLYPRNQDAIHLSTIHRSKGREFGNVIVVMNNGDGSTFARKGEDRLDDPSEPRVLFVALTRARDSLHRMEARARGIWLPDERWIKSFTQKNGFNLFCGIQAGLPRDVDIQSFAEGQPSDVHKSQEHLLRQATPGKPVTLKLHHKEGGCPVYQILIGNTAVGRMSTHFGWAVWHTLKKLNDYSPKKFPTRITGCWVKEIVTAVGDLACDTVDDSLRTSGLWMSLAIDGLGNNEWD